MSILKIVTAVVVMSAVAVEIGETSSQSSQPAETIHMDEDRVAVSGYDLVSVTSGKQPIMGRPQYRIEHEGVNYHFHIRAQCTSVQGRPETVPAGIRRLLRLWRAHGTAPPRRPVRVRDRRWPLVSVSRPGNTAALEGRHGRQYCPRRTAMVCGSAGALLNPFLIRSYREKLIAFQVR